MAAVFLLAKIDADRIKKSAEIENIDHSLSVLYEFKISATMYVIALSLVAWFDLEELFRFSLLLPILMLSTRWLAYDLFLNLLRGKSWDYESPQGDGASRVDSIEKRFKINFITQRAFALAVCLAVFFLK